MYDILDSLTEKDIKIFVAYLVNKCVEYLNTDKGGTELADLLTVCDCIAFVFRSSTMVGIGAVEPCKNAFSDI